MSISYQLFGPEASDFLSELQAQSFQEATEQVWSVQEIATLLQDADIFSLVVSEHNIPVGFVMWRQVGAEAEIFTLCILPGERGKGYACQLLHEFYDYNREKEVEEIFLEVRASNSAAISLYKKCGFKNVGRRKNYYRGDGQKRQDAIIMKYTLT